MTPRLSRRTFLHSAACLGAGSVAAALAGCRPHFATPPASALAPAGPFSLGAHAAAANLLYGCAVNMNALANDPAYAALIRAQCRILVAENAMKWAALRPTPTTFHFDQADALLAFAEQNHMKLRGHNLCWNRDNPAWFASTLTADNAREFLVTHIQTVAGRYAGRIHSWDVVNEAIEVSDGRPDGLRSSIWLRLLGPDYIELAYQTARDADPQALLTYNDYGLEPETPDAQQKRDAVLLLLRRMVARRVPIDALGVQSHLTALTPPATLPGPGLMRLLADVRELGLQVFLTELDVNDRSAPAALPARDAAVAFAYTQYLSLVLAEPAIRAVLTWGITDRYTWLDHEASRADHLPERPLPFGPYSDSDPDDRPTRTFFVLRDAFDDRPKAIAAIPPYQS